MKKTLLSIAVCASLAFGMGDKAVNEITQADVDIQNKISDASMQDITPKSVEDFFDEFNQKTIAKKNTLVAPDFSLSGKIRQDNIQVGGKTRVEYFFLLRLTDLNSGLAYWEDEKEIKKLGSSKSVSW